MPSLKDLKIRINSVKSTQKITSAMKMVAAAKLRRAQEQAEAARPYAQRVERMIASSMSRLGKSVGGLPLLTRNRRADTHPFIVPHSVRCRFRALYSPIVR